MFGRVVPVDKKPYIPVEHSTEADAQDDGGRKPGADEDDGDLGVTVLVEVPHRAAAAVAAIRRQKQLAKPGGGI